MGAGGLTGWTILQARRRAMRAANSVQYVGKEGPSAPKTAKHVEQALIAHYLAFMLVPSIHVRTSQVRTGAVKAAQIGENHVRDDQSQ